MPLLTDLMTVVSDNEADEVRDIMVAAREEEAAAAAAIEHCIAAEVHSNDTRAAEWVSKNDESYI